MNHIYPSDVFLTCLSIAAAGAMRRSSSSPIQPQHSVSINISSSSSRRSTTTTTTTCHFFHQQYERQFTRPSENNLLRVNMGQREWLLQSAHSQCFSLTQNPREAMQEHRAQIDIRPGETQTELLHRTLQEFGIPPELLHEVRSSGHNARTAGDNADTFVLRNQTTQDLTEVLFDQASSGVTRNVAVRSQQYNTALGPGSRVSQNNATDSEQRNCSVCVVM